MNYSILSRIFVFLLLVITFSGCGGSSKNQQTGITGIAQKGDFLKDSQISFARFSNTGASSTERLDGLILSNRGEYAVNLAWSDWTKITVTGIFYNEFLGKDSTSALSLNNISYIHNSLGETNVNLFTHLVAARIEYLVNHGSSVNIANQQALSEIKLLLGLTTNNLNTLDLTKNSHPDNAILLLFSSGFLATNTQQKFATSLDNLTTDFADNGLFDGVSASVFQEIANYSGKRNVFPPIYNNLIAKGYANPPNKSTLDELPNWVNKNPIVNIEGAESGKTILVGETVTLQGTATDPDGQISTYTWLEGTKVKGTDNEVKLNNLSVGEHFIELKVTDNKGASNSALIKITVNSSSNKSPNVRAGSDKTISLGESVTLNGSASDSDGSIASWAWKKGGITRKSGTGSTISPLTINNLPIGEHIFILSVTDNDKAIATDSVKVTVNAGGNKAPSVHAGSDKSIRLGASVTLNGSASDEDGSIASWAWKKGGIIQKRGTGSTIAPLTVNNLPIGTHQFTLVVTDNDGAMSSDHVIITVTSASNIAPIANAGFDKTIHVGESVTLNGSASDKDGSIASWAWNKGGIIQKRGTGSTIAPLTVNNLPIGTHQFTLVVTDNDGAMSSDHVIITVTSASNIAPIASAGSNQTITLGDSTTLTGSGRDPDGSIASWSWKKGTTVLSNGTGSTISSYSLSNLSIGSHEYTLEVVDNDGASATDTVVITVVSGSGNIPPTANAGSDKTIVELQSFQLKGQGTDTDGSIASYSWKEGSVNLSSNHTLDLKALSPGTHTLTLTVTDNGGATGSDNVTINVKALKVDLSNQAICRSKYGFNIQVIYSLSGNKTGSGNSELNLWSEPGCTGTRSDPTGIGFSRYAPATYVITSVSATGTSGRMAITSQGRSSTRSITINSDGRVTTIN